MNVFQEYGPVTCDAPTFGLVSAFNPLMFYDITKGDPSAQNILPPFPNLPAICYEVNGVGPLYAWNPNTGTWK